MQFHCSISDADDRSRLHPAHRPGSCRRRIGASLERDHRCVCPCRRILDGRSWRTPRGHVDVRRRCGGSGTSPEVRGPGERQPPERPRRRNNTALARNSNPQRHGWRGTHHAGSHRRRFEFRVQLHRTGSGNVLVPLAQRITSRSGAVRRLDRREPERHHRGRHRCRPSARRLARRIGYHTGFRPDGPEPGNFGRARRTRRWGNNSGGTLGSRHVRRATAPSRNCGCGAATVLPNHSAG